MSEVVVVGVAIDEILLASQFLEEGELLQVLGPGVVLQVLSRPVVGLEILGDPRPPQILRRESLERPRLGGPSFDGST